MRAALREEVGRAIDVLISILMTVIARGSVENGVCMGLDFKRKENAGPALYRVGWHVYRVQIQAISALLF